jgi:hypothetical protein
VLWALAATAENLFTRSTDLAGLLNLPQWSGEDRSLVLSSIEHWLETPTSRWLILDKANHLEIIEASIQKRKETKKEGRAEAASNC